MSTICKRPGCARLARVKGWCRKDYTRHWQQLHPHRYPTYKARWYAANVERESVRGHHYFICRRPRKCYAGMPFWAAWDPDKGGSFDAGGQWIIRHLGPRPGSLYELHIINRGRGFVPGNLVWVPQEQHQQEELINKLLLENQNLQNEIDLLRATR